MVTKVLKKDVTSYVRKMLGTNSIWATQALLRIYARQTAEEQQTGHTYNYNNIGFTGADSEILTSFAKQFIKFKKLSPKQMAIVYKKMPKYHRQIIDLSDINKLQTMIAKA